MKDLIIIGAYCPDKERLKLLENCVDSLLPIKKDYDFLISSHTHIPEYIADKVDYVFFDKKNELITDWNLINKPWFSPFPGLTIISALVTGYSTFLAVYRIFIGALGLARNFKYNKVHWVEYDSLFTNYDDFYENSKLLEDNTAVQYKKEYKNYEKNLEWGYGCFQSINIQKLDESFLVYDEERLTEILKNCPNKTNEKTTQEFYEKNGGKIHFKDFNKVSDYNKFNLSDNTSKETMSHWVVPFYDEKTDLVSVVVWNSKQERPINATFIINNENLINFTNVGNFQWSIREVGKLEDISSITTLIDGKLKNNLVFNDEIKNIFKKTNYAIHS